MATLVAEYLFNEAASGIAPSVANDNSGGGHDLTFDAGLSDAEWAAEINGRGINFLDVAGSAIASIADMSAASSIGGQLAGQTEASLVVCARLDAGAAGFSRLTHLGTSNGLGDFSLTLDNAGNMYLLWSYEAAGGYGQYDVSGLVGDGSTHVFVAVIDTTQALGVNRIRLWVDDVELPNTSPDNPALNETFASQSAAYSFCVGNRPVGNSEADAFIAYVAVLIGQLTPAEISASTTALTADTDVSPFASPPTVLAVDPVMLGGML